MPIDFASIQARSKRLEESQSQRNAMFQEMEDMYLLKADDLPTEDWIKETLSPDPRNSLLGATRLLCAADPTFSVPANSNVTAVKKTSSKIERFCAAVHSAICELSGRPYHYDASLSGLLYGELVLTVTLTSDLVANATSPAAKQQAEDASAKTPFLIDVINPTMCYPEYGPLGLRRFFSKQELIVGDVRDRWGEDQLQGREDDEKVNYCDYWDLTTHCTWVESEDVPLLQPTEHKLPFIPVVCAITEGSMLFYREGQQQRQPFLYTDWRSGLWNRKNLALTLMYSLSFAIGANPLWLYRRNNPAKTAPEVDFSTPGHRVIIDTGEDYMPLARQIIDPSISAGLEIAERKSEESTIYRQTLGEPLGSNAPFSMVALLSQAGRLPLTSYQRMISWAIGKAFKIGLVMSKTISGGKLKAQGSKGLTELTAADIPDQFNLEAKLDISMPQDDRQMVAVAMQATQGQKPLVSKRYARETWLKIGQSDDMDYEIAEENFLDQVGLVKAQMQVQQLVAQLQQANQQQQQMPAGAPNVAGPAEQAGPMPGQPMPPDLAQQMQGNLQSTGAEMGLPGMPAGAPMEPGQPGGNFMPGGPGQGMEGM
jgi:hypothetical protein